MRGDLHCCSYGLEDDEGYESDRGIKRVLEKKGIFGGAS
jgi:hypothetical protein